MLGTVEFHLSGLYRTAIHPDMQKNPDNLNFFLIGYVGNFKVGRYYLQYVPASKPFEHAFI